MDSRKNHLCLSAFVAMFFATKALSTKIIFLSVFAKLCVLCALCGSIALNAEGAKTAEKAQKEVLSFKILFPKMLKSVGKTFYSLNLSNYDKSVFNDLLLFNELYDLLQSTKSQ